MTLDSFIPPHVDRAEWLEAVSMAIIDPAQRQAFYDYSGITISQGPMMLDALSGERDVPMIAGQFFEWFNQENFPKPTTVQRRPRHNDTKDRRCFNSTLRPGNKPLKRTAFKPRTKPIAKRSKRHPHDTRPLTDAEREGGCQIHWDAGCQREATEVHHRKLRSQGGSDDDVNRLPGCGHCHREAHRHPKLSYATGVMIPREQAETPFARVVGWIIDRLHSVTGVAETEAGQEEIAPTKQFHSGEGHSPNKAGGPLNGPASLSPEGL